MLQHMRGVDDVEALAGQLDIGDVGLHIDVGAKEVRGPVEAKCGLEPLLEEALRGEVQQRSLRGFEVPQYVIEHPRLQPVTLGAPAVGTERIGASRVLPVADAGEQSIVAAEVAFEARRIG